MTLHSLLYLIICVLPWLSKEDSGVVSCCILHSLEFRVFVHLDWVSSKARVLSLPFYVTYKGEGREIRDFFKCICAIVSATCKFRI